MNRCFAPAAVFLLAVLPATPGRASLPPDDCEALRAACAHSVPDDLRDAIERLAVCRETARRAGDLLGEAESLRLLAELRGHQGKWEESLGEARQAVLLARRAGEARLEAEAVTAVGDALFYLRRFEAAAARFAEALALFEEAGDPLGQAHALKNLGIAHVHLGRRDLAMVHLERAMERYADWRDDALAVSILGNLGTIYARLGAPRSAERVLERALAMARARGRADEVSDVLGRLAHLHLWLGRPEAARELFSRALTAAEAAGPTADLPLMEGAALAFEATGDEAAAEAALERLLAKQRRNEDEIGTCLALTSLAGVLEARDPERAAELYREAEDLAREESLQCRWKALTGRGRMARASGDRQGAVAAFYQALSAVEARRRELVSDPDRARLAAATDSLYRDLAELLIERGEDERAFHVLERMRAPALTRKIAEARQPLPRDLPAEQSRHLRRMEEEIRSLRERLDTFEGGAGERREIEDRLLRRGVEMDEHLKNARRAAAGSVLPRARTALETREVLPAATALVSYLLGEERSFAFVVLPGRVRVVELAVPRERLAEQVEGFLDLVGELRHPGWATVGYRLFQDLVTPWLGSLGAGVETLVIVPDRELRSVPFGALPMNRRGGKLLVDEFAIALTPSATALFELTGSSGPGGSPTAPAKLLVFADPLRFPAAEGEDAARPLRTLYEEDGHDLSPVPFGRVEGKRVARHSGVGGWLLTGARATEARAKARDSGRFPVLHFATHALLSTRDPRRSALLLAAGGGEEDGFLQAREIQHLRLDADLVVLSACRTARGEAMAGAGIESLATSFFLAGARSVVGTLWNVEDRSAMRLMTSFYRHLARGRGKAQALRAAQLEAVGRGAPPADWAGFVLLGEPFGGVAVERPTVWADVLSVALPLLLTIAAVAAAWSWRAGNPSAGR